MEGPLFENTRSPTLPPVYKLRHNITSTDIGTGAYVILVDAASTRVSPVQMIMPKDGEEQRVLRALRQQGTNAHR